MMGNYFYSMNSWMYNWSPFVWIAPFALIDLVLKGFALWKAGRNNHMYWFIALLFVNSLGILPVIYLVFFANKKK